MEEEPTTFLKQAHYSRTCPPCCSERNAEVRDKKKKNATNEDFAVLVKFQLYFKENSQLVIRISTSHTNIHSLFGVVTFLQMR